MPKSVNLCLIWKAYVWPPVYFKWSLEYLWHLMQCKYYVDTCVVQEGRRKPTYVRSNFSKYILCIVSWNLTCRIPRCKMLARKHQTFFKVLSENSSILQGHTLSEHPLCRHILFSQHCTISTCWTRSKWRPCSALRIRGSLQSEAHLRLTLQDSPFHSIVMLPFTAETSP